MLGHTVQMQASAQQFACVCVWGGGLVVQTGGGGREALVLFPRLGLSITMKQQYTELSIEEFSGFIVNLYRYKPLLFPLLGATVHKFHQHRCPYILFRVLRCCET